MTNCQPGASAHAEAERVLKKCRLFYADVVAEVAKLSAEVTRLRAELAQRQQRVSRLEDAAFHFQGCATCAHDGEDSCESGRQFSAYLRGDIE